MQKVLQNGVGLKKHYQVSSASSSCSSAPLHQNKSESSQASRRQYLAAFSALLGAWSIGSVLCYTSPAILSMQKPVALRTQPSDHNVSTTLLHSHHLPGSIGLISIQTGSYPGANSTNEPADYRTDEPSKFTSFLTADQKQAVSWITSIINIGALIGSLVGGFVCDLFGHRLFLIMVSLLTTSGWLSIAFASSVKMVLIGRAVTGFCCGLISTSVPVYVVDISTEKTRGFLGCSFQAMITMGILSTSILGVFFDWRDLALYSIIPIALMGVLIGFMPESPHWLMKKCRKQHAIAALQKLRTSDSDINGEIHILEQQHSFDDLLKCEQQTGENLKVHQNENGTNKKKTSFWSDLDKKEVYKPLAIGLLLMFFSQMSGTNGLVSCLESIFKSANTGLSHQLAVILVNLALVLSAWLSGILVNLFGRKTLLLSSVIGYFSAYSSISLFYHWQDIGSHLAIKFNLIPLVALLVFFLLHAIGYGGVPWFLIPEMSVNSHRSQIAAMCSAVNWVMSFVVMKNFTIVSELIGFSSTFLAFALISIMSGLFVIFFVPETKDKSPSEIKQMLIQ